MAFTALDGNVQGYAKNRDASISPLAEQPESTLLHELAHVVLGHTAEGSLNSDSKDRTPKDIRELEAECVALLCCDPLAYRALTSLGATFNRGSTATRYPNDPRNEFSTQRMKSSRQVARNEPATKGKGFLNGGPFPVHSQGCHLRSCFHARSELRNASTRTSRVCRKTWLERHR
jgi:hypothetical protein